MEGRASSRLKLFSSCIRSLGRSAAMGNTETSRGWLSPFLLPLFLPPSLYLCVKSRGLWLMYVQVVYFWLAMKYEMTSRALKKWLAEWEISAGPPYVLFYVRASRSHQRGPRDCDHDWEEAKNMLWAPFLLLRLLVTPQSCSSWSTRRISSSADLHAPCIHFNIVPQSAACDVSVLFFCHI